ncbi:alpha/beta hydrolase [Microbulbifer spongiae]|uniref:Alpha/beta hydrolase-fold protein n=1 Tax=Microbulbifer spongiae TaxID=2944933 RepID=A0ABY9EBX3_9GAMM|nr:alpha/beta hydrolase-fold protein [Microbulbifer sp. MI-G]WKD49657.1 alpha/beta hydrolase-fold protein [Microbulbifer sp. MI-G]
MIKNLILTFSFLLPLVSIEASEGKPYEMPRTHVIPVKNSVSGWQYDLYIKLPEGYLEKNATKYPVIYFPDAAWNIEILSASTEFLMEEVILVGISWQTDIDADLKKEAGIHVSRYRDYTMKESAKPEIQTKYQLGKAGKHLNFIRTDIIDYVEKNYRVDPGNRTFFGYSLGSEFGAYILFTQPDTFKNYILGSPSLVGDIPHLIELASHSESETKSLNANVFVSYGSLEKELGEHAEKLIAILKSRNDKSLSLKHVVIEGDHQAALPMTVVRSVTWLSALAGE